MHLTNDNDAHDLQNTLRKSQQMYCICLDKRNQMECTTFDISLEFNRIEQIIIPETSWSFEVLWANHRGAHPESHPRHTTLTISCERDAHQAYPRPGTLPAAFMAKRYWSSSLLLIQMYEESLNSGPRLREGWQQKSLMQNLQLGGTGRTHGGCSGHITWGRKVGW